MGLAKQSMFDVIKDDLAQLEEELLAISQTPTMLITQIGTHLVKAGGKRLRPALYFLAAHSRGEKVENLQSLAIALELIHMATLVHDDVIDEASTRRGIPTANVKWGNQMSVLTGDYMFAKAFALVAEHRCQKEVLRSLSDVICSLSEGEIIQNSEAFDPKQTEEEYAERIAKKTAYFIAASCELGAIVAKHSAAEIEALKEYGYCLGMAFQVTDDILDITASSEQLGKPAGNDIVQGMVTLPVIRALAVSEHKEELAEIVATRGMSADMVKRGLELIKATDAIEYSYNRVDEYLNRAKEVLPTNLSANIRKTFEEVVDFVGKRNF